VFRCPVNDSLPKLAVFAVILGGVFAVAALFQINDSKTRNEQKNGLIHNHNNTALDQPALNRLIDFSDQLSAANALIIEQSGQILLERYSGKDPDYLWSIKSLSKSVYTSLLIKALEENIVSLEDIACEKNSITIRQLATMTGGVRKRGDTPCESQMLFQSGEDFAYSDASVNILLAKIQDGYQHESLANLLRRKVFEPSGIEGWKWHKNEERIGSGFRMTAQSILQYGRLWLNKGMVEGKRVLPSELLEKAIVPANPRLKPDYGFLWWVNGAPSQENYDRYGFTLRPMFSPDIPKDAFLGAGCTGAYLLVIPSLDLIAVRAGQDCKSIKNNRDALFSLNARRFVDLVVAAVSVVDSEKASFHGG